MRKGLVGGVVATALVGLLLGALWWRADDGSALHDATTVPALSGTQRPGAPTTTGASGAPASGGRGARNDGDVWVTASWGSGPGQLGRNRPQEANPEAPMSLALDAQGHVAVLDQHNGRIARFDAQGKPLPSVPLTVQGAQDLAIASDGTLVVLDRLIDRSVAVMDPSGALRGELPVVGKHVPEGGGVTGVFVDGHDVYVEREHGEVVRIGDTAGRPADERSVVPGRPSRDGTAFLSAGIVDPKAGRLYVTAVEREPRRQRFTREIQMGTRVHGIVLLDSDKAGTLYLGVTYRGADSLPEEPPQLLVMCLAATDGSTSGRMDLVPNLGPEETFRELTVLDEGGVLFLQRSEENPRVTYHACR